MRSLIVVAAVCAVLVTTYAAEAGQANPLILSHVWKDGGAVVTAVTQDVRKVTRQKVLNDGSLHEYQGYSFTLHVHEVLRGGAKRQRTIPIAFSQKGYGCNWEFDRKPADGMKLIVFLKSTGAKDELSLYPHSNATEDIQQFDDPRVIGLKKIFSVWELTDAEVKMKAVKKGCFDENARFQRWCVASLIGNVSLGGDVTIGMRADSDKVHMLMQRVFADDNTHFDTRFLCDIYYLTKRDKSFAKSGPRYEVYTSQLREFARRNRGTDHNHVNMALGVLSKFPRRAEQTLALLCSLADQPRLRHRWTILIMMRELYGLGSPELDQKLLDYLQDKLFGEDEQSGDGAAIAFTQIAAKLTRARKAVPPRITKLLRNADNLVTNQQVVSRLSAGLRELDRIQSESP